MDKAVKVDIERAIVSVTVTIGDCEARWTKGRFRLSVRIPDHPGAVANAAWHSVCNDLSDEQAEDMLRAITECSRMVGKARETV